jgi:hypothetical protein
MGVIKLIIGVYMKLLLVTCLLAFSSLSFAINADQIDAALRQMEASGTFSKAQIAAARKQLKGMDDKQIKALEAKAQSQVNNPKVRAKAQEMLKNYKK